MSRYHLSPSHIARYYYHECERYLRYTATPASRRLVEGIPSPAETFSPVTRAILDEGLLWEEQVIERFLDGKVHIAAGDDDIRDRVFKVEETAALLRRAAPGEYIYQPTLETAGDFYAAYGLDEELVEMGRCRPDLIQVLEHRGRRLFRVIDVKASDHLKFSHRVQVTLYTLFLEHFLRDRGLKARVDRRRGGVWLYNQERPQTFDIGMLLPPVEHFLREELTAILSKDEDQVHWHVFFRCEWCDYYKKCREDVERSQGVSQLPYLSNHARRFLRELPEPVDTLPQLRRLLGRADRDAILSRCLSLANKGQRLERQLEAFECGEARRYGGTSCAMPVGEHIRVVFTLQREPVGGEFYTYGVLVHGGKGIVDEALRQGKVAVAENGGRERLDALARGFVCDLFNILRDVDVYNRRHKGDWQSQKSVQFYVADTYERSHQETLLVERLKDPVVARQALAVLFHFYSESLLKEEQHPSDQSAVFPLIALTSVLRSLFALPVPFVYRFAAAVEALPAEDWDFEYSPSDFFAFDLSNQMRSDACFHLWRGEDEYVAPIRREVMSRLRATMALIQGIRDAARNEQGESIFFAWPPKFFLPHEIALKSPLLSRLWFFHRYEVLTTYIALREARMPPRDERLASGSAALVEYRGGDRFFVCEESRRFRWSAGFDDYLMARDDPAGERALHLFKDLGSKWGPLKDAPLVKVDVLEEPELDNGYQLRLGYSPGSVESMGPFEPGDRFQLCLRFKDAFTENIAKELMRIDKQHEPLFVRMVEDPLATLSPSRWSPVVRSTSSRLAAASGMTTSQRQAFERAASQNLTLVWGPPGTGKTTFLALAILCAAEAHRRAARPLRIGVTAFTNAAIDNLLRKLVEVQEEKAIFDGELPMARLVYEKSESGSGIAGVEEVPSKTGKVEKWCAASPVRLIATTVWQLRKDASLKPLDFLIIDEGSQVKVCEAAVSISRLRPSGTLLIAGDHCQLPPIVHGSYPEPEEGEPVVHRSIFECLMARDAERRFTSILLENFRMNETLCRYPAAAIYDRRYTSATEAIAARRLDLAPGDDGALAEHVLDPDFPLVVCVLDGVQAAAENRVEAGLVADLALALRRRLRASGSVYPEGEEGDRAFWRQGLFVVSPHHVQIDAIQRALRERRDWASRPFVDTVDKMQGQECDAVLVSYGVSDAEYAMREKQFIYSFQRLNVSITRARSQSVVFLPKPLIEPPLKAYEDEDTIAGVAFMRGLLDFARKNGGRRRFDLSATESLEVFRCA